MPKIIVAAPPVPGEFTPLLQVARGLAARGHQVTVLSGSGFRPAVEQAGLAFAPLAGTADYDIRKLHSQPGAPRCHPARRSWPGTSSTPSSTPCRTSTPRCRNCCAGTPAST